MEKAIGLGWHLAGGHGALSKVRKWKLCELRSKRQGRGKTGKQGDTSWVLQKCVEYIRDPEGHDNH